MLCLSCAHQENRYKLVALQFTRVKTSVGYDCRDCCFLFYPVFAAEVLYCFPCPARLKVMLGAWRNGTMSLGAPEPLSARLASFKACANSPTWEKRCFGSLASALSTTRSTASEMEGTKSRRHGGGVDMCCRQICKPVPENGSAPQSQQ